MTEKKKILLVDDDIDMIESMKLVLEANNYSVSSAASTEDGLKKMIQENPDLVILDVMFGRSGKTEGLDLAVAIRKDEKISWIPVLMITSVNNEKNFKFSPDTDGNFLPVDGFIDKPVQPDQLIGEAGKMIAIGKSKWINWPVKGAE
ncbi:MAG: hypothetical protein A2452_06665 [Candidatus Firestonebacteria bacterium RIFOXYC2_FULL_39_67]|nr:MAG: hypothetical protein A2452_06665 [Candidatus Firestonebacteria bacterium RIFOXYC2_FULL_39_67]